MFLTEDSAVNSWLVAHVKYNLVSKFEFQSSLFDIFMFSD